MREIKFDYLIKGQGGKLWHCPYTLSQLESSLALPAKDPGNIIARRQYTGLKDKNGVEIYEADIVERSGARAEVKFRGGAFIADWGPDMLNKLLYFWDEDACSVEVIGDIHSNPELLKKETP